MSPGTCHEGNVLTALYLQLESVPDVVHVVTEQLPTLAESGPFGLLSPLKQVICFYLLSRLVLQRLQGGLGSPASLQGCCQLLPEPCGLLLLTFQACPPNRCLLVLLILQVHKNCISCNIYAGLASKDA